MVGYNFDGGGSKRMTTDEREATRALGGIALLGGIGYLYLTSKAPARPVKALTLFSAGAFQERGSGFVIQNVDVKNPAKQTLVGFDTNQPINIFATHNGEDSLTAVINVKFQDGSSKSISKSETSRVADGETAFRSSFDIEPNIDFDKEIIQDGNSISEYTVTLNVSGKGKTKTIAFIVGA